jgi:hypothetical protein
MGTLRQKFLDRERRYAPPLIAPEKIQSRKLWELTQMKIRKTTTLEIFASGFSDMRNPRDPRL